MKYGFSRSKRLFSRAEFRSLYRKGSRFFGDKICIYYAFFPPSNRKLGITISKKWGKAHERNRFKRLVRESYRLLYSEFPTHIKLNIEPKISYQSLTLEELQQELKRFILIL